MDKPLILVIDDEKRVADNIAEIIRRTEKYEAVAAYSAKEGFEALKKNRVFFGLAGNKIRLIVLDIKMPEMDGLQFLRKMRREYGTEIGVTMLTAYEDDDKWSEATGGFVINYIKKPYDPKELIATLDGFFAGQEGEMVLSTFEKHLEKKEEWKKEKESKG